MGYLNKFHGENSLDSEIMIMKKKHTHVSISKLLFENFKCLAAGALKTGGNYRKLISSLLFSSITYQNFACGSNLTTGINLQTFFGGHVNYEKCNISTSIKDISLKLCK